MQHVLLRHKFRLTIIYVAPNRITPAVICILCSYRPHPHSPFGSLQYVGYVKLLCLSARPSLSFTGLRQHHGIPSRTFVAVDGHEEAWTTPVGTTAMRQLRHSWQDHTVNVRCFASVELFRSQRVGARPECRCLVRSGLLKRWVGVDRPC